MDVIESLIPADSPARDALQTAARRHRRSVSIQVIGRPGTGRDTMARAVRARLGVAAMGPGEDAEASADADLWIYLLAGLPRPADFRTLAQDNAPGLPRTSPPPDRTLVVLGKADTHGDFEVAAEVAARAAERLGRPVLALSQLLACAEIDADDHAFLHSLHNSDEHLPSMAGHFLAGVQVGSYEYRQRVTLLRRLDHFGIDTALELFAAEHPAAADADHLNAAMRTISGIGALATAIAERDAVVRHWRTVELRTRLERIAAAGVDRDTVEEILRRVAAQQQQEVAARG